MDISLSLNAVLDRIDYSNYEGELGVRSITGVASLKDAKEGDASFLASGRYLEDLSNSRASLVVLPADIEIQPKPGQLFLRVENPSIEIAKLCELIAVQMWKRPAAGVHRLANIHPGARIEEGVTIEAFVTVEEGAVIGANSVIGSGSYIGESCRVGSDCRLSARVTLERDTVLGNRVRLHSGVVLGSDGFGYEFENGRHRKVPQVGSVRVDDDVEIGANTTVDRGRFGMTRVGEGTKIDNLVQIGHNVVIGKHCILCGLVGLAGSTTLGNYVVMGGKAAAAGHLTICDGAQIAGETSIFSDIEKPGKYGGSPAVSLIAHQRLKVLQRRLPELFQRVKDLESRSLDK